MTMQRIKRNARHVKSREFARWVVILFYADDTLTDYAPSSVPNSPKIERTLLIVVSVETNL